MMAETELLVRLCNKSDTKINWETNNPVLSCGEIGYDIDSKQIKIGDGKSNWNNLAYMPLSSALTLLDENKADKQNSNGGFAGGEGASAGAGFAGGKEAKTQTSGGTPIDAVQLGTGTNNNEKTLQVYNYTLMNADGSIPSDRLSNAPKTEIIDNLESTDTDKALSANQGNQLKTLIDSKVNISDIVDNLTSVNTDKPLSANQGKELKTLVDSKANKQTSGGGFEGGKQASATNGGAVGNRANTTYGGAVGNNANAKDGGAVGNRANTTYGGAVGNNANTTNGGAVGSNAKTSSGFAGGYYAKTVDSDGNGIDAIQLGIGTNPKAKTLQVYDYTLMNADGSIPSDRLGNVLTIDELERLQYYGDKDIVPSDSSYFTVNATGETITGLTDTGKTQTGTLVIPYKINGVEITEIGIEDLNPTYSGEYNNFNKIVLPNTITSISDGAFWNCESITSINIPDSVTYIGSFAFSSTALTSINLPDGATIPEYAFQDCTSLTTISIPNINSSIDTNTFNGCTSLESIKIPNNVTSIGNLAFANCTLLTSIEIPSTVTSISDDAFSGITPSNLTVYCEQGSYAETYANTNGFNIVYTDIKNFVSGIVTTITVPTEGWTTLTDTDGTNYYTINIEESILTSSGYPVSDVVLPTDIAAARLQYEAYQCINKITVNDGVLVLYCFDSLPTVSFQIRIQIMYI